MHHYLKWISIYLWLDQRLAAHVWLQYLRYINRTVFVQVVFQKCNKHSWWCCYGIIQGMSKVSAFFSVNTDS